MLMGEGEEDADEDEGVGARLQIEGDFEERVVFVRGIIQP